MLTAPSSANTREFSAQLPLAVAETIERFANEFKQSSSWVIEQALNTWARVESERNRLTNEALVNVDSKQLISHSAVQDWVAQLDQKTSTR